MKSRNKNEYKLKIKRFGETIIQLPRRLIRLHVVELKGWRCKL